LVHYKSDGIFDAPIDKLWRYIQSEDDHKHSFLKSSKVLGMSGNTVTVENESYSPDGKTTYMSTATHAMNPPQGMESSIKGGPMDGARWKLTYTPMGDRTKVDMEGDFSPLPGMDEKVMWKMLDDFFTNAFNEDNANLKKMR
jgi:hypothetical protein